MKKSNSSRYLLIFSDRACYFVGIDVGVGTAIAASRNQQAART